MIFLYLFFLFFPHCCFLLVSFCSGNVFWMNVLYIKRWGIVFTQHLCFIDIGSQSWKKDCTVCNVHISFIPMSKCCYSSFLRFLQNQNKQQVCMRISYKNTACCQLPQHFYIICKNLSSCCSFLPNQNGFYSGHSLFLNNVACFTYVWWHTNCNIYKTNNTHTTGIFCVKNLDIILFIIRTLIISCLESGALMLYFLSFFVHSASFYERISSDELITILEKKIYRKRKHTYLWITRQFVGEF